jgi:hypothetical protein
MLRFTLCILLVSAVPGSAIAAKRTISLSQADGRGERRRQCFSGAGDDD